MVVTLAESKGEYGMTATERYHCMVMVGSSMYHLNFCKQAESMLKKAMLHAKSLIKAKVAKAADLYTDGMSEIGQ